MISRYERKIMKDLFSEQHKYENMLKVEIAVVHYYTTIKEIPEEDYLKIKNNATFTLSRIHEIEEITKHDVIAFTRCLSESLGEEKKWIHYGLTSTDVVDTAQSLTLKEANEVIEKDLDNFIKVLKDLALKYKYTPCIGRTHGIHAEITSFGLKIAKFYAEMLRNKERFIAARKRIEVGKLSGAVGNFANTDSKVEEFVCQELGLDVCLISTQVLPRDLHIEYIYSLAQIANTLNLIATEIRSLSRTEIAEVQEAFTPGQKGSSAMPHKKNPISSENICGLSRVVKAYVNVAFDNNALWHERDISHSSSERIILADSATLVDYMLNRYEKVLSTLVVNEKKMLDNIYLTKGIIFSGRVLNKLLKKVNSREVAYDLIQELTFKAYNEQINFKTLLLDSIDIRKYLTENEIEECFTIDYYMKNIDVIYKRLAL